MLSLRRFWPRNVHNICIHVQKREGCTADSARGNGNKGKTVVFSSSFNSSAKHNESMDERDNG